jgi:hypothetical protein
MACAFGGVLLQLADLVLRDGEDDVDGRDLGDQGDAVGVAVAHHIADVHGAQADAAAHGRDHAGVAEVEARRAFVGLVDDDRAFELLDQRGLGVDLLAGDGVLLQQGLEALQVTRALSSWASSRWRWPLACIRAISNWRGSMVASSSPALTIWPSLKSTFSITPETCGRTRTVACGVTVPRASRTMGMLARSAVATPTVVAGAPRLPRQSRRAAGRVGGGMGQVPGQPAYAGQGEHGDHAADDGRAAADAFAGGVGPFRRSAFGSISCPWVPAAPTRGWMRHFFVFDAGLGLCLGQARRLVQTALRNYHCKPAGAGIRPERGA